MISDLGWILIGLAKPVLDDVTGAEVEAAAILAGDLAKMLCDGSFQGKLCGARPCSLVPIGLRRRVSQLS
ncbi:hypothetical protein [Methylobacterium sp. R2-1]|uniref:hypothetical protein n=1 Tax=Methylobacterium sp. R2-1 TaxID=2587064 RepID=UPI00162243A1|nr:hypothetical protein [Methylobacterium sp. R2-1]MBB2960955.1 hypothetical protein [Methylobacterium sp. R2-1]